jgi:hypothetical protein
MKNLNTWVKLNEYMNNQIQFFVERFKEIGWKQEDISYLFKRTPFMSSPDANNDDYRYGLGMVLYADFLKYEEEGQDLLIPWVVGRVEIENPTEEILKNVTDFIKAEVGNIGWKMFHDEDAYRGYFSKEDKKGWTQLKFYLNREYPNGYWQNHAL